MARSKKKPPRSVINESPVRIGAGPTSATVDEASSSHLAGNRADDGIRADDAIESKISMSSPKNQALLPAGSSRTLIKRITVFLFATYILWLIFLAWVAWKVMSA